VIPRRWDDVERIVEAALVLAPHQRASLVADACGGDTVLRAEVESLLAQEAAAEDLLSTPAAALLATSGDAGTFVGRQFGTYAVVELLGVGGMGEVYRARDRQLDRDVAIKILPPAFITDPDRLARFEREAKILAALNHPHIGAIYGLERAAGMPALVLELVEGPTLADRLAQGPLTVTEAISIATQIADALNAAHSQGIVHRDLKPGNIKVTPTGVVKLLDFGLAKAVEHDDASEVGEAVHGPVSTSRPGAILGTAAYMAPEQARGEPADARSDLFSFGAVLYETLTSRRAFSGETASAILRAILNDTPQSPRAVNPGIPVALEAIVMRLLSKERKARPQRAADVRNDLQLLARKLEPASNPRLRWLRRAAAAAAIILAALVIWTMRQPEASAPAEREITQITHFADSATSPAFSSNGRLLTFIRGRSTFWGRGQIYVKALPDGEPIPLTSDPLPKMSPVFSPDDSTIAYTAVASPFVWNTWTVPVGGGSPKPWLQNASGLSWLRSGRLIFSEMTVGLHMQIVTSTDQPQGIQLLYSPQGANDMAHRSLPSPDGAWVLIAEMKAGYWQPCRLVPSARRTAGRQVGPSGGCTYAAWSPDGKWMYFSSNSSGAFHLWRQRFPDGVPEQLTFGPTEEEGIAPDPDGRSLLTSLGTRRQSIWIHDERGEREISREGYAFVPRHPNGGVTQPLSADGRSVFYLVRQGAVRFAGASREAAGELWATDLDTGRRRPILTGRPVTGYDVSRDGTRLVFAALEESGASRVWVSRADGSEPKRLTDVQADSPRFDRAGNIYYRGTEDGLNFIYRLREGGKPEKVVQQPVLFFMTTSPRGDWLLARVQSPGEQGGHHMNVAFPTAGGLPVPLCDGCEVDWSPNGNSLVIRMEAGDLEEPARTFVVALARAETLPAWPADGVRSRKDLSALRVVGDVNDRIYPSDDMTTYVSARETVQRNIYRVPLP